MSDKCLYLHHKSYRCVLIVITSKPVAPFLAAYIPPV